jgi:periplasmic protein TonB
MNFAQENKAGSRSTAFVGVVLLHVLVIWAIASGLAKKVVDKVAGPLETKVIEEIKPPPPPPEKIVPPPPDLKAPPPPFVPIPEIQVQAPPPPTAIQTQSQQVPPPAEFKPAPPPTVAPPPPQATRAGPVSAGVVCTKRPQPEISAEYDTPAEFEYTLTLQGGKVVAKAVRVIRGVPDRRAQRSILQALDAAVAQYECGTYSGEVVQQFLVKPGG